MPKTFLPTDVLRYVYQEGTPEELATLRQAIETSEELSDLFYDWIDLKSELDQALEIPSDACTDRILAFSRQYRPVQETVLAS